MIQSLRIQRIMNKNADMGQKKQSQNKPNFPAPTFRMPCILWGIVHRKPRSMRIKKLTTSRMVANLRFEELNSGFVVSKFGQ